MPIASRGAVALAIALMATLCSDAYADQFEPNQNRASAAGPLLSGRTYVGDLATASDYDFFRFNVSAPRSRVRVTVSNTASSLPGEALLSEHDYRLAIRVWVMPFPRDRDYIYREDDLLLAVFPGETDFFVLPLRRGGYFLRLHRDASYGLGDTLYRDVHVEWSMRMRGSLTGRILPLADPNPPCTRIRAVVADRGRAFERARRIRRQALRSETGGDRVTSARKLRRTRRSLQAYRKRARNLC